MYLEHANITVNNLDQAIHFFNTAFPSWEIRGGGESNKKWIHMGTENTYMAINEKVEESTAKAHNYYKVGINHLGFVVENVDEIADRLLEAGYKRNYERTAEEFRIREYFLDTDGNEFEFIQYLSEKDEERNMY